MSACAAPHPSPKAACQRPRARSQPAPHRATHRRLTENGVTNLEDLLNLSAGDMKALRLNLGQRNRLTKWLARQQSEASDASAAPAAPGGQCTAAGTQVRAHPGWHHTGR